MFAKFLILTAVIGLSACNRETDYDRLCRMAEQVDVDHNAPATPREVKLARRVDAEKSWGTEFGSAWLAISGVDSGHRYRLLQAGAEEIGQHNWQCPTLLRWWPEAPAPK